MVKDYKAIRRKYQEKSGKINPAPKEPEKEKGSYSPLIYKDEQVGAVVRTRTNVKPLFISVGNKCNLDFAIKTTLACTKRYRLPEPTRLAHQTVTKLKPSI